MSISENIPPVSIIPREYTPDKGKFVAEYFAAGISFRDLAEDFPEYLPAAMYIKQWRRDYPSFNALMVMAETAKADFLVDEAVMMADDITRPAAHTANSIKIRLAQAAALDQMTYGNKRIISGDPDNPLLVGKAVRDLNDDELMTIARGGVVEKLTAETPTPPLLGDDGGACDGVLDTTTPTTTSPEDSVTTSDKSIIEGVISGAVDIGF